MTAQQDALNLSQSAIRQQLNFDRRDRRDFRPITLRSARLSLNSARSDRKFYDQHIRPVHKQYLDTAMAPVKPRTAQVARDAMLKASAPFDQADQDTDRRMSLRGLDPSAGQSRGLRRDTGMHRATARTHGITNAVENEQRRTSDLRFSRLQSASESGAGLRTPNPQTGLPTGGTGDAASQASALAGQYGGLAQQYRQGASSTLANAIDLADRFNSTSKYVDGARQLTNAGGGNPITGLRALGRETLGRTGSWGDLFAGPNAVSGTSSLYAAPGSAGEFAAFGDAPFGMISEGGIGTAPGAAAGGTAGGTSGSAASFFNSNTFGLGVFGVGLALTQLAPMLKGGSHDSNKTGQYLGHFQQSPKKGYGLLSAVIRNKQWLNEDSTNIRYVVNDALDRGLINGEYVDLHAGNSIVDLWNADPTQNVALSEEVYRTSHGLSAKQAKEYKQLRADARQTTSYLGGQNERRSAEAKTALEEFESKYLTEGRRLASAKKLAAKYKKAGIPRKKYRKLADYIEGKNVFRSMNKNQRQTLRNAVSQVTDSYIRPMYSLDVTDKTLSNNYGRFGRRTHEMYLGILSDPKRYGAVGARIKRMVDKFGRPVVEQQLRQAHAKYYTQLQEQAAQYRKKERVGN